MALSLLLSSPTVLLGHLFVYSHQGVVNFDGAAGQPQGLRVGDVSDPLAPHELPDPVQTLDVEAVETRRDLDDPLPHLCLRRGGFRLDYSLLRCLPEGGGTLSRGRARLWSLRRHGGGRRRGALGLL